MNSDFFFFPRPLPGPAVAVVPAVGAPGADRAPGETGTGIQRLRL